MPFGRRPVAIPVALGGGTGCDHPCAAYTPLGSPGSSLPRKVAFSSRRSSPRKVASPKGKGVLQRRADGRGGAIRRMTIRAFSAVRRHRSLDRSVATAVENRGPEPGWILHQGYNFAVEKRGWKGGVVRLS